MFHNLVVSIILCTVVIGALIFYKSRRSRHESEQEMSGFWEREARANSVRRKDISNLDYITIPFDTLPFVETTNYDITSCQKELLALKGLKLVNLSGMSNTDLKMEYGVANLPLLSEYDDACTRMHRILANLGYHLSKEGYHKEAVAFLEFGIKTGTDISRNLYVLADEYIAAGEPQKVEELIKYAESITTAMGPSILNELKAKLNGSST